VGTIAISFGTKLEHVIPFFPTVIFISLLIFLVGVADWLWHMHHAFGAVIITGIICGIPFYVSTTAIGTTYLFPPSNTRHSLVSHPNQKTVPLSMGEVLRHIANVADHIKSYTCINSDTFPRSFKTRERNDVLSKKGIYVETAYSSWLDPCRRLNLFIITQEKFQPPAWKLVNDHTHSTPLRPDLTLADTSNQHRPL
jgi:hypothetical protein